MSGPLDRVTTVEIDDSQLPLSVSVSGLTTDTDAVTLANLATTYTAAGVEVLSQIFSTNGKQRIRVALHIAKTLNPTDILIKLYTHSDTGSVDEEHHQEDFWADLRLSGASVGAGVYHLSLSAWCIAPACQVGVTANGVNVGNFFTITKPRAYLL